MPPELVPRPESVPPELQPPWTATPVPLGLLSSIFRELRLGDRGELVDEIDFPIMKGRETGSNQLLLFNFARAIAKVGNGIVDVNRTIGDLNLL